MLRSLPLLPCLVLGCIYFSLLAELAVAFSTLVQSAMIRDLTYEEACVAD
eukprot:m.302213 g.302213  ORF g.302213 m.302213 type:complete len:50 (-) comp15886_c1_seq9:6084-6233(-)